MLFCYYYCLRRIGNITKLQVNEVAEASESTYDETVCLIITRWDPAAAAEMFVILCLAWCVDLACHSFIHSQCRRVRGGDGEPQPIGDQNNSSSETTESYQPNSKYVKSINTV